jgi:hypothetical protein
MADGAEVCIIQLVVRVGLKLAPPSGPWLTARAFNFWRPSQMSGTILHRYTRSLEWLGEAIS